MNSHWLHTPDRSYLRVDGVEFLNAVQRVCLCLLDDLLRVVEEEQAEQDQASVDRHRVQAGSEHGGGGQEHGAWRWTDRRGRRVYNHVNRQVLMVSLCIKAFDK